MFGGTFYRGLPYLYALICILEVGSNFFLMRIIARNWSSNNENATITTTTPIIVTTTTTIISTTTSATSFLDGVPILHLIAVAIAFLGSIVPIFTGLILVLSINVCCCCLISERSRRPFLRFISLNCNCPCYIPRPKLRFTIRFGFHLFCIVLRVAAVMIYAVEYSQASTDTERKVIYMPLFITGVSLIFPFLTILLDIYHYRVWWAYKPDIVISPDVVEKPFSRKHKRFIPYTLTEPFRTNIFGNRKCQYGIGCQKVQLEYVVIFHSSDYRPQPRWSEKYPFYIGFHRTTPVAAYSISKSDFNPSPRGMLGPNAYFARSTVATSSKIGNADQIGAWFVAAIRMGKVLQVDEYSIRPEQNNPHYNAGLHHYIKRGHWARDYDTCYFKHHRESKDEFCIRNPAKQILRWVIIIEPPHDRKLYSYGLLSESDSSACGCI